MRVFLRAPLLFPQSFRFRWMVRLALGAGMVLVDGRRPRFFCWCFIWRDGDGIAESGPQGKGWAHHRRRARPVIGDLRGGEFFQIA